MTISTGDHDRLVFRDTGGDKVYVDVRWYEGGDKRDLTIALDRNRLRQYGQAMLDMAKGR